MLITVLPPTKKLQQAASPVCRDALTIYTAAPECAKQRSPQISARDGGFLPFFAINTNFRKWSRMGDYFWVHCLDSAQPDHRQVLTSIPPPPPPSTTWSSLNRSLSPQTVATPLLPSTGDTVNSRICLVVSSGDGSNQLFRETHDFLFPH